MALQRLLDLISREGTEPRRDFLARWTDTPEGIDGGEPDYGFFVDDRGRVVSGLSDPLVSLDEDDPRLIEADAGLAAGLPEGARLVFLDWGRQPLSWEEIFELWEVWSSQGMVVSCGSVAVAWSLANRWVCPGWIAFRDGFDGSPLATVQVGENADDPLDLRGGEPSTAADPVPESFLARARRLRGNPPKSALPGAAREGERLPMLPFTLSSLKDPGHVWPVGAA